MARRSGALVRQLPGKFRRGLSQRLCGAVRRVTLDQVATRPTYPDDLRLPPFGQPIWDAFWQIEKSRQGGYGPQAFTYLEIKAWADLADERLRPWEVRIVMAMDEARRDILALAAADEASTEELTPELYEKILAGER